MCVRGKGEGLLERTAVLVTCYVLPSLSLSGARACFYVRTNMMELEREREEEGGKAAAGIRHRRKGEL